MTADFLMLFIYLLLHFIIVSLAVFIGLWVYYATEWVMDKFLQKTESARPAQARRLRQYAGRPF